MAISIDTVYQRVLAIANKEQRGYITPQQFNLFANQAQLRIFEQYFYDLDKFLRLPGNDSAYSDRVNILEEKIAFFEKYNVDMTAVNSATMTLPTDVYRLGTVFYNDSTKSIRVESVTPKEVELMQQTALYKATQLRPVYARRSATTLQFYPSSATPAYATTTVNCNYTAKPTTAAWGYNLVLGQALYNSGTSTDFELHPSEETSLVFDILELAGIMMEDPNLVNIANQEEASKNQQELM